MGLNKFTSSLGLYKVAYCGSVNGRVCSFRKQVLQCQRNNNYNKTKFFIYKNTLSQPAKFVFQRLSASSNNNPKHINIPGAPKKERPSKTHCTALFIYFQARTTAKRRLSVLMK